MGELFAELFTTSGLVALLTLTILEIVLGIDNVIFISILSNKLPADQQEYARKLGITLAVISRITLLFILIVAIERLQSDLFTIFGNGVSGRDIVLIVGGLFLIGKSTHEIHEKLEGHADTHQSAGGTATLKSVMFQVMLLDVVFSLDSVITAIGIAENIIIMIIAILIAATIMVFAANAISAFVEKHPTMKILALAFLILIGAVLVIEGWNEELAHELHIKRYVYFAIAFSLTLETINIRLRNASKTKTSSVDLRSPRIEKALTQVEESK